MSSVFRYCEVLYFKIFGYKVICGVEIICNKSSNNPRGEFFLTIENTICKKGRFVTIVRRGLYARLKNFLEILQPQKYICLTRYRGMVGGKWPHNRHGIFEVSVKAVVTTLSRVPEGDVSGFIGINFETVGSTRLQNPIVAGFEG